MPWLFGEKKHEQEEIKVLSDEFSSMFDAEADEWARRWQEGYRDMSDQELQGQIDSIRAMPQPEQELEIAYTHFVSPARQASMMEAELKRRHQQ